MEEEQIIKNNVANIENRIDQKLKEIDRMMGKTVDDGPKQELQIQKEPSPLVKAGLK